LRQVQASFKERKCNLKRANHRYSADSNHTYIHLSTSLPTAEKIALANPNRERGGVGNFYQV